MSASVAVGLLLALATAFVSVVGFLCKHRGAVEAPEIRWSAPVRSSLALFGSRWYALGIVVAMGGWALHVGALALAPISLVQTVIAGGLVLLTVVADRLFGHEISRREWIGVGLTAAGLAVLAGTLAGAGGDAYAAYDALTLWAYVGALGVAGCIVAALVRRSPRAGSGLALAAGLLWASSDTAIKALSGHLGDLGAGVLLHPLALLILVASLVGLLVSAGSLQIGEAVPVIAITSAAANICTIAAGPLVFREPLPDGTLSLVARLLAFALVVVAAALTPAPVHAAESETVPDPETAPAAVAAGTAGP